MYIAKNNRPRMERYGTSQIIVFTQDVKPYIDTFVSYLKRKIQTTGSFNDWFRSGTGYVEKLNGQQYQTFFVDQQKYHSQKNVI